MLTNRKRRNRFDITRFWAFNEDPDAGTPADLDAGVTTEVEFNSPAATETNPIDWNTLITDDLKEKDYFQNILKAEDPGKELVKQFDNAQTLIGKKTVGAPPAVDASDEDWNKYYESVRPKTADEYDLKPLDLGEDKKELAEFINSQRDDEFTASVKAAMHKYGLTKKQAEGLASEYDAITAARLDQQTTARSQQFDALTASTFGGDKDKAISIGSEFIKSHTSEAAKALMPGLSDEALIIIADIGVNVNNKYIKEDKLDPKTGGIGKDTYEELQVKLRELIARPGHNDSFAADHEAIMAEKNNISKQMAKLKK